MKIKILTLTIFFLGLISQLALAKTQVSFEGNIDFSKQQAELVVEFPQDSFFSDPSPGKPSKVIAKVSRQSEIDYILSLNIEHLRTRLFHLSSELQSSISYNKSLLKQSSYESGFQGKVWSRYSLVDFKPTDELQGQFEIRGSKLLLSNFSLGDVACSGYAELAYPYKLDLDFQLDQISLQRFLKFWVPNKDYDASGLVSGTIKAAGPFNQLALEGNLTSDVGHIKSLKFDNIRLKAQGVYPNIMVADSTLAKTGGMNYSFDGLINLKELESFKKQVKELNISPVVEHTQEGSEWTLKQRQDDPNTKTAIKYFLREEERLNTTRNEGADMLAVERKMEF